MKRILCAFALMSAAANLPAADVGLSISIGQPGFYGTIDIGDYSRPAVIYAEPIVVRRSRIIEEPLYLRVPPRHAQRWSRYCDNYNACGRPVYFVRDDWYNNVYAPAYRERHGQGKGHKRGNGKGHGNGRGNH